MIGSLRGKLLDKKPPTLLVEVAGVGYEVDAPMSTCFRLPEVGCDVFIYTHMVVREDAQLLYGFSDDHERSLFRDLIKINGVGPKLALSILSSMDPHVLVQCVLDHDVHSFTRIPGVGKKTAERLMIEMQDRIKNWDTQQASMLSGDIIIDRTPDAKQDAISALVSLGYKQQQAQSALKQLPETINSSEEMIKYALQNM